MNPYGLQKCGKILILVMLTSFVLTIDCLAFKFRIHESIKYTSFVVVCPFNTHIVKERMWSEQYSQMGNIHLLPKCRAYVGMDVLQNLYHTF